MGHQAVSIFLLCTAKRIVRLGKALLPRERLRVYAGSNVALYCVLSVRTLRSVDMQPNLRFVFLAVGIAIFHECHNIVTSIHIIQDIKH